MKTDNCTLYLKQETNRDHVIITTKISIKQNIDAFKKSLGRLSVKARIKQYKIVHVIAILLGPGYK